MSEKQLRIVSWNVNGLRSLDREQFFRRWIERTEAFAIGIQEVRARVEQLPKRLVSPKGWHTHYVEAERKGYSGVGMFSRHAADKIVTDLAPEFDREGRFHACEFGRLVVANIYFPNGSGVNRDHSRVSYKLDFYRAVYDYLDGFRDRPVLVMGDFNTAHADIDLARPKQNRKTSGFLDVEREELSRWLASGWSDTFRMFETAGEHYSWWSQRFGVREKNIGWRLDLVLANDCAREYVKNAFIMPSVMGSDHCPVGVDVSEKILG